jgi:hypothetical protein
LLAIATKKTRLIGFGKRQSIIIIVFPFLVGIMFPFSSGVSLLQVTLASTRQLRLHYNSIYTRVTALVKAKYKCNCSFEEGGGVSLGQRLCSASVCVLGRIRADADSTQTGLSPPPVSDLHSYACCKCPNLRTLKP